ASILLLLYSLVAEEQGVEAHNVTGTTQNDILKEYLARGTYIYPPGPSMRITTDMFAYCARELPRWNTISISGYHIREAGSTAVQELAFTLSNAIAYVEAAVAVGLDVDQFAPRLSFFFNAHNDLFQEVAKYRAARRMWARIMRERFGASDERSLKLRFHTQTAGSSLTAQQAENNVVRTTVQALSAVLGGTQSLHTNAFDEALALPTERSARIALRTQQILASEGGLTGTADPLAGSYYVESLTDAVEEEAWTYIQRIDEMGGSVKAVEERFMQREIEDAAYRYQREVEKGERVIVGVNRYTSGGLEDPDMELHSVDEGIRERQTERLAELKDTRDNAAVQKALADLKGAAEGTRNLLYPMKEALSGLATLGEVSDTLRGVFGEYRPV
ncbi:MAG TPA: methylmalonyl-CoA mutase family protein, partial [Rubrobacter sp.]|nr:methylmalonyl-CoA mutase family protein [Rubrobacter sp.]